MLDIKQPEQIVVNTNLLYKTPYDNLYVNFQGNLVYNNKSNQYLSIWNHNKYKRCALPKYTKNQKQKFILIHDLVLKTFIQNDDESLVVNHIDFDTTNNCVKNLEYVSTRDNNLYKSNGTYIVDLPSHCKEIKQYKNKTFTGYFYDSIENCVYKRINTMKKYKRLEVLNNQVFLRDDNQVVAHTTLKQIQKNI